MRRAHAAGIALCLLGVSRLQAQESSYADHVKAGIAAYRDRNYLAYLDHMQAALRLEPGYPRLIYNVASGEALLGRTGAALRGLRRLARMGLSYDLASNSDFAGLRGLPAYREVVQGFERNLARIGGSRPQFALAEKDLLAEGVAYDAATGCFYVGSVHQRKVVKVDSAGGPHQLVSPGQDGLWSAFGLRIDRSRRALWVASAAAPQMIGYTEAAKGQSGVFAFDLASGTLLKKYLAPQDAREHWFGDLVIDPQGNVFISDSRSPAIYRIGRGSERLESFLEDSTFVSLQGLALAPDGQRLFVADYVKGIYAVDLRRRTAFRLVEPEAVTLRGTDGLYWYGDGLIAIQNGITPHRVVRVFLNRARDRIERLTVLEANHPLFSEPTLGDVAGDTLFYVANSQWASFREDGSLAPLDQLHRPVVLRLELRP